MRRLFVCSVGHDSKRVKAYERGNDPSLSEWASRHAQKKWSPSIVGELWEARLQIKVTNPQRSAALPAQLVIAGTPQRAPLHISPNNCKPFPPLRILCCFAFPFTEQWHKQYLSTIWIGFLVTSIDTIRKGFKMAVFCVLVNTDVCNTLSSSSVS